MYKKTSIVLSLLFLVCVGNTASANTLTGGSYTLVGSPALFGSVGAPTAGEYTIFSDGNVSGSVMSGGNYTLSSYIHSSTQSNNSGGSGGFSSDSSSGGSHGGSSVFNLNKLTVKETQTHWDENRNFIFTIILSSQARLQLKYIDTNGKIVETQMQDESKEHSFELPNVIENTKYAYTLDALWKVSNRTAVAFPKHFDMAYFTTGVMTGSSDTELNRAPQVLQEKKDTSFFTFLEGTSQQTKKESFFNFVQDSKISSLSNGTTFNYFLETYGNNVAYPKTDTVAYVARESAFEKVGEYFLDTTPKMIVPTGKGGFQERIDTEENATTSALLIVEKDDLEQYEKEVVSEEEVGQILQIPEKTNNNVFLVLVLFTGAVLFLLLLYSILLVKMWRIKKRVTLA